MDSTKQHKKIKLSGSEDCNVVFCPACDILELNVGALTLRLKAADLKHLNATLMEAGARLARIKTGPVLNHRGVWRGEAH